MSVLKEFKEFAVRGNVIDMAVGVIIGGAFGKIVSSFVNDVVMPPIGKLVGGVNFSELYCNLSDATYNSIAEATAAGAPIVKYGAFIQTIIDFTIVAFVIFMAVKGINSLKKKEVEAAPAAPAEDVVLLKEIRDLLKK